MWLDDSRPLWSFSLSLSLSLSRSPIRPILLCVLTWPLVFVRARRFIKAFHRNSLRPILKTGSGLFGPSIDVPNAAAVASRAFQTGMSHEPKGGWHTHVSSCAQTSSYSRNFVHRNLFHNVISCRSNVSKRTTVDFFKLPIYTQTNSTDTYRSVFWCLMLKIRWRLSIRCCEKKFIP